MTTEAEEALQASRHQRLSGRPHDYRSPGERDSDRILYSSAFRRLGGVTQVVAVHEVQLFHNRLTHSLKVAQIGKRAGKALRKRTLPEVLLQVGGLHEDIVEAACLAHDLGHPPFGHIAEKERTYASEWGAVDGWSRSDRARRPVALPRTYALSRANAGGEGAGACTARWSPHLLHRVSPHSNAKRLFRTDEWHGWPRTNNSLVTRCATSLPTEPGL